MRIAAGVMVEQAYFDTCMNFFVGQGDNNCLSKIHLGNVTRVLKMWLQY